MKKGLIKLFIDEIYSKPPKKNNPTNKIIYNHIDKEWIIDLADFLDYEISNNERFRYIVIIIDNFSKDTWAIPLKNKNSQTITSEFSINLPKSKRRPLKLESDEGADFHKSIFQNFFKSKKFNIIQDIQIKILQ